MIRLKTKIPYEKIINKLKENGFEAYPVGGCVRDSLLDLEISDVDITSNARPEEIEKVFSSSKLIDIGKKFGTIKIIDFGYEFEVTTFRAESAYRDRRHPEKISFADNIYDDLKRRDFTINAMAFDRGELIDPFGGRLDLEKKIIRAVGDAKERIDEDLLRSMRAVRFASRLGFTIEESLMEAIRAKACEINLISKERIGEELSKILISDRPSYGIRLLDVAGIISEILPELYKTKGFDQHSSYHQYDVYEHSLHVLANTSKDLVTRFAALYHDVGKIDTFFLDERGEGRFFGHQKLSDQMLKKRLRALKFSNKFIEDASMLVARHMDCSNPYSKKSIRKLLRRMGEVNLRRLFDLQRADIRATNHPDTSNIDLGEELLCEVLADDLPKKRSDLAINGSDLLALGYPQGKIIGELLSKIEEEILEEKLKNEKSAIVEFLTRMGKNLDSLTYK